MELRHQLELFRLSFDGPDGWVHLNPSPVQNLIDEHFPVGSHKRRVLTKNLKYFNRYSNFPHEFTVCGKSYLLTCPSQML